jgi:hypothetical protein
MSLRVFLSCRNTSLKGLSGMLDLEEELELDLSHGIPSIILLKMEEFCVISNLSPHLLAYSYHHILITSFISNLEATGI